MDIDGNLHVQGTRIIFAVVASNYEAYCELPDNRKRRRRSTTRGSTSSAGVADMYAVSFSNDGSTYSASVSVVSLDSTCLNYNGSSVTLTVSSLSTSL